MKHFVFSYLLFVLQITACAAQTLSLEEKVGQLLMVHFHGEAANEDARILIQDIGVGGIIYYNWANGLNSPQQVQQLSISLQQLTQARYPSISLFIAADQEGGVVARLQKGFTIFPGNRALGETHDPNLAEEAAFAMGTELRAVGINLNFAPVVDVNSNPRNPVIGVRSFGEDPEKVYTFGRRALDGFKRANIMATLKHFPGHGDVEIDSHENLPVIHKSIEELTKVELLPFARLAPSADLIMTAHLLVTALDKENCSTLSEKTLNYLRNQIGFNGVIITDSLVMEGVLKKCTIDEAAIQALNAGCDILLLGGKQLVEGNSSLELSVNDIHRIHRSIVNAVKTGRVAEERINQSISRVLRLKERYLDSKIVSFDFHQMVNTPNHKAIAQKIASQALKEFQHETEPVSSIRGKKVAVFAPEIIREAVQQTSLIELGNVHYFNLTPTQKEIEAVQHNAAEADLLLVCSYNAWKNPAQLTYIQTVLNSGKPGILLVLRDPLDAQFFTKVNSIFMTYSPTAPSIQAAYNALKEKN